MQDGAWGLSSNHLTVLDGDNRNNCIRVPDADLGPEAAAARARIRAPGGELTAAEYETIRQKLGEIEADGESCTAPTAP